MPEENRPLPAEARQSGDEFRNLFADFNRDPDDDLPSLELIEEGDVDRIEEAPQGENIPGQSGQDESGTSSRPVRQLRNRNGARSVKSSRKLRFHDEVYCVEQDRCYQESIHFEKDGSLFPPFQFRDDIEYLSRERWELLYDPTPSRALKRTRQQASVVAQQMLAKPQVSTVCLLNQKTETTGYTVLSDSITKKMDREERKYQKAMMICVQGIGASLTKSTEALDVVDGLGQSHHESLRSEVGIMG